MSYYRPICLSACYHLDAITIVCSLNMKCASVLNLFVFISDNANRIRKFENDDFAGVKFLILNTSNSIETGQYLFVNPSLFDLKFLLPVYLSNYGVVKGVLLSIFLLYFIYSSSFPFTYYIFYVHLVGISFIIHTTCISFVLYFILKKI